MRSLLPTLLALVVSAVAVPALADDGLKVTSKDGSGDEAEAVVDDTKVPMEQDDALKLFAGATWKCSGTSSTEYGADVPTTLTIKGTKDIGGRWVVVKTELKPSAKGAKAITSEEIWGWSRAEAQLVRTGASSHGGFLSSTSTGWSGERFAWTGTSAQNGKKAKEKLSFEKKSDKELVVEVSLGADELRVIFEGTCKK